MGRSPLPDGGLELGAFREVGLVTNVGEELVASAYNGTSYFQVWCVDSAYAIAATSVFLSESVWCTRPATIATGSSWYLSQGSDLEVRGLYVAPLE